MALKSQDVQAPGWHGSKSCYTAWFPLKSYNTVEFKSRSRTGWKLSTEVGGRALACCPDRLVGGPRSATSAVASWVGSRRPGPGGPHLSTWPVCHQVGGDHRPLEFSTCGTCGWNPGHGECPTVLAPSLPTGRAPSCRVPLPRLCPRPSQRRRELVERILVQGGGLSRPTRPERGRRAAAGAGHPAPGPAAAPGEAKAHDGLQVAGGPGTAPTGAALPHPRFDLLDTICAF